MKLENQVCSLELAKQLKELGVKQDSLFYWVSEGTWDKRKDIIKPFLSQSTKFIYGSAPDLSEAEYPICYSAFTVAELGEMLPVSVPKSYLNYWLGITRQPIGNKWEVSYSDNDEDIVFFEEDSEADARAEMLIYLLENKLT